LKSSGRGINSLQVLFLVLLLFLSSPAFSLKKLLSVPFLCQAPFGNWGEPYQEACEETALIMARHYQTGKPIYLKDGDREILDLVDYQERTLGGHFDLTAKQVKKLAEDYYKMKNIALSYEFSIEDMKRALDEDKVVIVPAAGRLLRNPYYTPPGPAYHNLLIIGYDDGRGEFITNDAGTKRGKNYRYKYQVVYNAIHDWAGSKANIEKGKKALLTVGRDHSPE
jgi:hypothetical protein